jgi:trimeric autotransporter adhesin
MIFRMAAAIAGMALAAAVHPLRAASELTGRVLFAGVPVPGATIEAVQADRRRATVTSADGAFRFAALDDGVWNLRVGMRGFVPLNRIVTVPNGDAPLICELTMQSFAEMMAAVGRAAARSPAVPLTSADEDIDFITGSVTNGAATPFAQPPSSGNNRPRRGARYNGGFTVLAGNSAWNARPFSFGGVGLAPSYNDVHIGATLIGPLRIPGIVRNGPQFTLNYQHGALHSATSQFALMPTDAQRRGDFSSSSSPLHDPIDAVPFAENMIPADRISPQAAALLAYYPRPNAATARGANYEKAVVAATATDALQASLTRNLSARSTLSGSFAFQRSVTDTSSLFDFQDSARQSTIDLTVTWTRRVSTRLSVRATYQFGRTASTVVPFFAARSDVSGDAGIDGNDRRPQNWGPPSLSFPDLAGLRDVDYQRAATVRHGGGIELALRRGIHNITIGGDVRSSGSEISSQPDPRGTLAFTGAISGQPFADFLLGLPSVSTIGFGPPAIHLSGVAYDAYATDDWRLNGVTLTLGARYEYEPPLRRSLLRPDRTGIEPRLAASWRPIAGSTLVLRSGYGIYRNLGVYQPLAQLLAFQPPFARTLSLQSSPSAALTLGDPFPASIPSASTFIVDGAFRSGYAHNWHLSAQRDLPGSLTIIASYLGTKGSRLLQASLPNTYPPASMDPCPSCPRGFVFVTSNGSSLRNAAQLTLRRRLHNGLTASAVYTFARAIDTAATFSNALVSPHALSIAQDWRDPDAERGPSAFDQRHLLSAQVQYTSGSGERTTLLPGLVKRLLKDWTIGAQLNAGSGLPFTPIYFAAIGGSGFTGVRPRLTGISPAPVEPGSYANAAAYAAPQPGAWGNAGRHSIRGPRQFSLDANLSRSFRLRGSTSIEAKLAATNVLNRVTFSAIGTTIASPQFGRPTIANPMRRLQATLRFRF